MRLLPPFYFRESVAIRNEGFQSKNSPFCSTVVEFSRKYAASILCLTSNRSSILYACMPTFVNRIFQEGGIIFEVSNSTLYFDGVWALSSNPKSAAQGEVWKLLPKKVHGLGTGFPFGTTRCFGFVYGISNLHTFVWDLIIEGMQLPAPVNRKVRFEAHTIGLYRRKS